MNKYGSDSQARGWACLPRVRLPKFYQGQGRDVWSEKKYPPQVFLIYKMRIRIQPDRLEKVGDHFFSTIDFTSAVVVYHNFEQDRMVMS